ncbi:splicing factor 3B subunit 4-like [Heliangelus exortis]|uniref:splicing factor 3B subunit 4-like n=1 Tax=Heliangelus exortis TaxID=472823 RepID=UPI003A95DD70
MGERERRSKTPALGTAPVGEPRLPPPAPGRAPDPTAAPPGSSAEAAGPWPGARLGINSAVPRKAGDGAGAVTLPWGCCRCSRCGLGGASAHTPINLVLRVPVPLLRAVGVFTLKPIDGSPCLPVIAELRRECQPSARGLRHPENANGRCCENSPRKPGRRRGLQPQVPRSIGFSRGPVTVPSTHVRSSRHHLTQWISRVSRDPRPGRRPGSLLPTATAAARAAGPPVQPCRYPLPPAGGGPVLPPPPLCRPPPPSPPAALSGGGSRGIRPRGLPRRGAAGAAAISRYRPCGWRAEAARSDGASAPGPAAGPPSPGTLRPPSRRGAPSPEPPPPPPGRTAAAHGAGAAAGGGSNRQ